MKIKATIPRKDLAQALKTVERYGKAKLERTKNVVKRTTLAIDRDAKLKAPVNEGVLRSSINFGFDVTGLIGVVEVNSAYAFFVENGRGPGGFPPLQMIARWAYLKRITKTDKLTDPETKQIVYLIGRKIARYGTKPQPFLKPAFEANAKSFYRDLLIELKALERSI